eukprot:jgi/Ulvmu1/2688/UM014_0144.1
MEPASSSDAQTLLDQFEERLRETFRHVLEHHHSDLRGKFDKILSKAEGWCKSLEQKDFDELERMLEELRPDEAILVASAFSHMLNLHNLSENVVASVKHCNGAQLEEAFTMLRDSGKTPEDLYKALTEQSVDLVFTAHPTQAMRGSVRKKYDSLFHDMTRLLDRPSSISQQEVQADMYADIQAAWRTDEIRRRKPTPLDEMLLGLEYVKALFDIVPKYTRRIDSLLESLGQPKLPLETVVVTFGSWMGGDRDGNPNVRPQTTRDVVITSRLAACNLYMDLVSDLMSELSIWRCSQQLQEYCQEIWESEKRDPEQVAEEGKRRNYSGYWAPLPPTEPFRCVLGKIRDQLFKTRELLHHCLSHPTENLLEVLQRGGGYTSSESLLKDLTLLHSSLIETGDDGIADSVVRSAIRRVTTFGSSLVRLDIRQESTRHRDVMAAITAHLGLGNFSDWSEEEKQAWLTKELQSKRPLFPHGMELTADQEDVVDTFRVLATLPPDSLGAYIISMAQTASDVLTVVLLQRELGVKQLLRVVPLFETLDDLNNAPSTMEQLFANDWYRSHIGGKQECMIGYSDSGKDAGRLAAAWALYQAQETLAALASQHEVKLTLFHGRGGTVGRGGGPAHLAVLSQPPGTVNGSMRVTVQGETIEQQFGHAASALHTLDLYTSSVLRATLVEGYKPSAEFQQLMQEVADESCTAYRKQVHHSEPFVRYFHAATPVAELGSMNIGSRPAKRKPSGGISTLRAIPWIFAWTQTRFHLPVWLGAGEAIMHVREDGRGDVLDAMYAKWPFFRVTMDMMAMVLAKGDEMTLSLYEAKLVDPELHPVGDELRASFRKARQAVLSIVGDQSVLGSGQRSKSTQILASKLKLRSPYVVPLNVLQALVMQEIRAMPDPAGKPLQDAEARRISQSASQLSLTGSRSQNSGRLEWNAYADAETWALLNRDPESNPDKDLLLQAFKDTLIITIKGIAAGMQNTG